jgi:hypothetical protein
MHCDDSIGGGHRFRGVDLHGYCDEIRVIFVGSRQQRQSS